MDLAPDSDARLVARCRSGDEQAWAELVERFSRYVYAIAVQAFRLSEPDAEDVFQDVFARIYERLYSLRDDEAVRPWIAQLTRRARAAPGAVPRGSRPLLHPRRELPDHRRRARSAVRNDREPHLPLPRTA